MVHLLHYYEVFDSRIGPRSLAGRFRAKTGRFGERSRVATKSKLEQAVERQAENLNEVQRHLVMSQLSDFKRNKARMAEIDDKVGMMDVQMLASPEKKEFRLAQRQNLIEERGYLSEANIKIAANLFAQLSQKEQ